VKISRNTEYTPHKRKYDADLAAIMTDVTKPLERGSLSFQRLINFDQGFTQSAAPATLVVIARSDSDEAIRQTPTAAGTGNKPVPAVIASSDSDEAIQPAGAAQQTQAGEKALNRSARRGGRLCHPPEW